METATDLRKALVANLVMSLGNNFSGRNGHALVSGNIKWFLPELTSTFRPDLLVIQASTRGEFSAAENVKKLRAGSLEIIVNVLPKGVSLMASITKLSYYKLIPSLQYILFVDQYRPLASVYARTPTPDGWLNTDYRTLESIVRMGDVTLPMATIYRKITF